MNHPSATFFIPFNCPLCRKLVLHYRNLINNDKLIFEAFSESIVLHSCLKEVGVDYWKWKLFRILEKIGRENEEDATKVKFKPNKLSLKKHYIGLILTREDKENGSFYKMLGMDGLPIVVFCPDKSEFPPYSLAKLVNLKKSANKIFRASALEVYQVPEIKLEADEYKEYYRLSFETTDSQQLEIFTDKIVRQLRKSKGKVINLHPLEVRFEEPSVFGLCVNFVSRHSIADLIRQISIPTQIRFSVELRKIGDLK